MCNTTLVKSDGDDVCDNQAGNFYLRTSQCFLTLNLVHHYCGTLIVICIYCTCTNNGQEIPLGAILVLHYHSRR